MLRFVVDGLYPVPGISFPLECRSREQGPVNTWKATSFPAPRAVGRPAVLSARGHGDVTPKPLLTTRLSLGPQEAATLDKNQLLVHAKNLQLQIYQTCFNTVSNPCQVQVKEDLSRS